MSPGLLQDFKDGYITFWDSSIISWNAVLGDPQSAGSQLVIITAGSQSGGPEFESYL